MGLFDKLKGELVDIIEWIDDSRSTLAWRFPRYQNEIKNGAQLIVREGQKAVFVYRGSLADQFEPGTHLDRWMFRMAQRVWLNELRSRKVRTGGGLVPVEDIDLPDKTPGAETNILARDVLNKVNALPEAQRHTVFLVYVEGYSYKEAAEFLEIPIGTVMSRLAAARKRQAVDLADTRGHAG